MVTAGQAARLAAVSSPLGEDALLLRRLRADEQISRSFTFDLELLSENTAIRHEQLLGQRMTVRYQLPAGATRYFDGLVSQFCYLGEEGRYAHYRARVDSWLWYLTRSSDCQIFQNKTVPQIVKEVFADYPMAEFQDRLTANYRSWDYCVQYRETDYNFVNRLLEQEGIHYFFVHAKGKHTLILADRDSTPERITDYDRVPFYPPENGGIRERDHVSEWLARQEVRSGSCVLRDFDFEKPRASLESRRQSPRKHALAELELYDYPGTYLTSDEGELCSRIRLEEAQADQEILEGSGDVAGLMPGCAFSLAKHPRQDQNREYRVLATTFELTNEEYESRGEPGAGLSHHCAFTAVDNQRPYRPPRVTPKPLVQGPQTAIVTGPAGEEIWTDKYGRVKVQFHWDRLGKRDENSSCWVRVSHPWAGKNWGAVAVPRIGQEVIVEFLEGDPDRPIITGRVYNAATMPPYDLPGSAMISGLKSDSTKGGGGYNEYVMDDTKGNELIREHGQYDKDSTIEHDLREHVLNDRSRDVTRNESISIGEDRSKSVGKNETSSIGENRTEDVGKNERISIGESRSEDVRKNEAISIGENRTEDVGKDEKITIGQHRTENVAKNEMVDIGENRTHSVGKDDKLSVGKTLFIDAGDEIVIQTGSAKITMKKNGDIIVSGKKLQFQASSDIYSKATGDVVFKCAQVKQN